MPKMPPPKVRNITKVVFDRSYPVKQAQEGHSIEDEAIHGELEEISQELSGTQDRPEEVEIIEQEPEDDFLEESDEQSLVEDDEVLGEKDTLHNESEDIQGDLEEEIEEDVEDGLGKEAREDIDDIGDDFADVEEDGGEVLNSRQIPIKLSQTMRQALAAKKASRQKSLKRAAAKPKTIGAPKIKSSSKLSGSGEQQVSEVMRLLMNYAPKTMKQKGYFKNRPKSSNTNVSNVPTRKDRDEYWRKKGKELEKVAKSEPAKTEENMVDSFVKDFEARKIQLADNQLADNQLADDQLRNRSAATQVAVSQLAAVSDQRFSDQSPSVSSMSSPMQVGNSPLRKPDMPDPINVKHKFNLLGETISRLGSRIAEIEKRSKQNLNEKEFLSKQLANSRAKASQLSNARSDLQEQFAVLNQKLKAVESQLTNVETEHDKWATQIEELSAKSKMIDDQAFQLSAEQKKLREQMINMRNVFNIKLE